MTNQEIYEQALALLAQDVLSEENEDFAERAPYLIASFCIEAQELNKHLRHTMGLSEDVPFEKTWIAPDADFPLLARLAPIAALYVAAMLIIDEDGELSDTLYERYCDKISSAWSELPAALEPIGNSYFAS